MVNFSGIKANNSINFKGAVRFNTDLNGWSGAGIHPQQLVEAVGETTLALNDPVVQAAIDKFEVLTPEDDTIDIDVRSFQQTGLLFRVYSKKDCCQKHFDPKQLRQGICEFIDEALNNRMKYNPEDYSAEQMAGRVKSQLDKLCELFR